MKVWQFLSLSVVFFVGSLVSAVEYRHGEEAHAKQWHDRVILALEQADDHDALCGTKPEDIAFTTHVGGVFMVPQLPDPTYDDLIDKRLAECGTGPDVEMMDRNPDKDIDPMDMDQTENQPTDI